MTDTEKLTLVRLLMAIDAEAQTHRLAFTISLPPQPGEWERHEQAHAAIRAKARANLDRAIAAARTLVEGAA